jgi:hypothetical protein
VLGVEQVGFHLFGHVVGVASMYVTWLNIPFATDKYENRTARLIELIVGQVSLENVVKILNTTLIFFNFVCI